MHRRRQRFLQIRSCRFVEAAIQETPIRVVSDLFDKVILIHVASFCIVPGCQFREPLREKHLFKPRFLLSREHRQAPDVLH